jgi:hypothetical protein
MSQNFLPYLSIIRMSKDGSFSSGHCNDGRQDSKCFLIESLDCFPLHIKQIPEEVGVLWCRTYAVMVLLFKQTHYKKAKSL